MKKKNKKKELFHILWMRNCVLSCLRGLQWYWAFMNSFDIRAERYQFQHKFFSPWHYYWKLLSVHCDKKLIIILDIWWIAFIKVLFFYLGSLFVCACVKACKVFLGRFYFLERKKKKKGKKSSKTHLLYGVFLNYCYLWKSWKWRDILLPNSLFQVNIRKIYIHTS